MDSLTAFVQLMVTAIDDVVGNVSPVFFAHILRPRFEEITIHGKEYLGPAAAQAPLWLVDLTLWKSQCLRRSASWSALVLDQPDEVRATLQSSAVSLARILRILMIFHGRHLGIARKPYHEEVRLYEAGSGGGVPAVLLEAVLGLTRENLTLVRCRIQRGVAGPPGEQGSCARPSTGKVAA